MNDVLSIKWDTGGMNIYMGMFFPCSAAKYNKLLKIVQMDTHAEEVMAVMKQFFQKRIPELETDFQTNGRLYWDYRQKEADTQNCIQSGKFPNGLPLTKKQMKEARQYYKECGANKRTYERAALKTQKQKEWFEQKVGELNG